MSEDKYRKGYEDVKREIRESEGRSIPEQFVRGVASLPFEAAKDFMRSGDEDRGRADALNGRDYDYDSDDD